MKFQGEDRNRVLAVRWQKSQDISARNEMVLMNIPLVKSQAGKYRKFGAEYDDLVSEGTIGLMRAIDTFDTERGIKFSTYAMWWIRHFMIDLTGKVKSAVQFSRSGPVDRVKRGAMAASRMNIPPSDEQLASNARVTVDDLKLIRNGVMRSPVSLNQTHSDTGVEFQELLRSPIDVEGEYEAAEQEARARNAVQVAMGSLDELSIDIIKRRHLSAKSETLQEVGQTYGLSRERIRQIESKALRKIKRIIENKRMVDLPGSKAIASRTVDASYKCFTCGDTRPPTRHKYCSDKCNRRAHEIARSRPEAQGPHKCERTDCDRIISESTRRFCGPTCRRMSVIEKVRKFRTGTWSRETPDGRPKVEHKCERPGCKVIVPGSSLRKCCSEGCRRAVVSEKAISRARLKHSTQPVEEIRAQVVHICEMCGFENKWKFIRSRCTQCMCVVSR